MWVCACLYVNCAWPLLCNFMYRHYYIILCAKICWAEKRLARWTYGHTGKLSKICCIIWILIKYEKLINKTRIQACIHRHIINFTFTRTTQKPFNLIYREFSNKVKNENIWNCIKKEKKATKLLTIFNIRPCIATNTHTWVLKKNNDRMAVVLDRHRLYHRWWLG